MNGFDVQSATEVAKKLRSIQLRANDYGKSRDELLKLIGLYAAQMTALAARIEAQMEEQAP